MDDLGVDPKGDPAKLSGGEARRAAIVRVLAAEPDIMLLDEPTNHLDLDRDRMAGKDARRIARRLRGHQP